MLGPELQILFFKRAAFFQLVILHLVLCVESPFAKGPSKPSMTVVIRGTPDEACASSVSDATVPGSARERYVTSYDDGTKGAERKFGKYLKTPLFDHDHLIRVNPADPRSEKNYRQKIAEKAKRPT